MRSVEYKRAASGFCVGVNVAVERKKTDEGVRSLLGFVAVEGRWGLSGQNIVCSRELKSTIKPV